MTACASEKLKLFRVKSNGNSRASRKIPSLPAHPVSEEISEAKGLYLRGMREIRILSEKPG